MEFAEIIGNVVGTQRIASSFGVPPQADATNCVPTTLFVYPGFCRAMILLNGDLGANVGNLLGDLLSLFLRDTLFNRLGSLVNHRLRLFQAQACNLTHNFDNVALVGADLLENRIKLGLLINESGAMRSFNTDAPARDP